MLMTKEVNSYQAYLFAKIQERLGKNVSVVKWLQEVLAIESSAASRKVSGITGMKVEQLLPIIEKMPGLLEDMIPGRKYQNGFMGNYSQFRTMEEVDNYLKGIIESFGVAVKNEAELKYFARDLPLFFFLANRELANYKFSMWTDSIVKGRIEKLNDNTFSLIQEVNALYQDLNTTEIWYDAMMVNQRAQIHWYRHLGAYDDVKRDELLAILREELDNYRGWAAKGKKRLGNFRLLFSRFSTMNNGGLMCMGSHRNLMTALSGVFYVSSANEQLCESFERQFEAHKASSVVVSTSNALEREKVFKALHADIFTEESAA